MTLILLRQQSFRLYNYRSHFHPPRVIQAESEQKNFYIDFKWKAKGLYYDLLFRFVSNFNNIDTCHVHKQKALQSSYNEEGKNESAKNVKLIFIVSLSSNDLLNILQTF